jgi:hypothetical protein
MSTGNMRRAQLVTPFGVGAMSVLVNGTNVITAGLDHWFEVEDASSLALEEYIENDWRLADRLRVKEFRLPPDYRPRGAGDDNRNVKITVPVLRFPRWCFCMYCKRLKLSTLTMQSQETCPDKEHADRKYKPRMAQVPFVAVCANGHLDDFPFDKWVHRSQQPKCDGVLRLASRGGGGLEGQVVTCDKCQAERSLRGITVAHRDQSGEERTTLTDQLSPGEPYLCSGARPWLAEAEGSCQEPTRAALRSAGNVYFPKVESSIYLPRTEGAVSAELHDLLRRPDVGPILRLLHELMQDAISVEEIRKRLPQELFAPISDDEILAGYRDLFGIGETVPETTESSETDEVLTGNAEWRHPEFLQIRETPKDDYLAASDPGLDPHLAGLLDRVRSVDVLRETRALRGFTRVRDGVLKLSTGKALLRRQTLPPDRDWLPAYVVKGEGIYLELAAGALTAWEQQPDVVERAQKIEARYTHVAATRGLQERALTPRFIMLHTLAHLIINELVFTCGYSSASLRERLYVSQLPGRDMAGVLLYTAAGDSEGTMGGLVRMAQPARLRAVLDAALDDARWCSTDPVCMDAGEHGQGPESCNLAACHGCALLPETSCEEFNRFLDRGLVVGTFANPSLGFFNQ